MTCATQRPPIANPPAASVPTTASGQLPASTPESPPSPGSAMDAAGSTTDQSHNATEAQAQALQAITQVGILSASLYCSLSDMSSPTVADASRLVAEAGEMRRYANEALTNLVDLLTELISEKWE